MHIRIPNTRVIVNLKKPGYGTECVLSKRRISFNLVENRPFLRIGVWAIPTYVSRNWSPRYDACMWLLRIMESLRGQRRQDHFMILPRVFYPPSQKTTGLPVDECANASLVEVEGMDYATARCRPQAEADNRIVLSRRSLWRSRKPKAKTGNIMGQVYPWGSIVGLFFLRGPANNRR